MAIIEVKFKLPEELVKEAGEIGILSDDTVTRLLREEIERRSETPDLDEAKWEQTILSQIPGISPDGSINFNTLRQNGLPIALDDLYSEGKSNPIDEA